MCFPSVLDHATWAASRCFWGVWRWHSSRVRHRGDAAEIPRRTEVVYFTEPFFPDTTFRDRPIIEVTGILFAITYEDASVWLLCPVSDLSCRIGTEAREGRIMGEMWKPGTRSDQTYAPSPAVIRRECERIQGTWSERERRKRAGWPTGKSWTPPQIETSSIIDAVCDEFGSSLAAPWTSCDESRR